MKANNKLSTKILISFLVLISSSFAFNYFPENPSTEIDTLYYLPDSAVFISEYGIAGEIYDVHTRFEPQTGWESYKIKEIHFLFTTMVIGETLNEVEFFKDTLSTLMYSQPVGVVIDSGDVYPNWYKLNISDDCPAISGIVEVPVYVIDLFSLCMTEGSYLSGHTIGFFEGSQSWEVDSDRPIKLIIERLTSGIGYEGNPVIDYKLYQNYPNPFNSGTRIDYEIPEASFVTIKVYDVLGNKITTLVDEELPAGKYEVKFVPESGNRSPASGVYFYQLKTGLIRITKKMILLR